MYVFTFFVYWIPVDTCSLFATLYIVSIQTHTVKNSTNTFSWFCNLVELVAFAFFGHTGYTVTYKLGSVGVSGRYIVRRYITNTRSQN